MDDIITTLGTVSKGYISAEVLKILYTLDPLTQRALAGAVGSGAVMVINQHVNFATAFKTAFFDVAPREKQQALPLRPDYQETMPQAEEYGGFASYIFFGEDPLAFCVSERTLDAAVVSSKVAEPQKISFRDARGSTVTYSPSQIVIVESDLCLKLGDALAFSATGAAVPEGYVLAANAMFNRIKDNWFQNLFIRAKLLQVWEKIDALDAIQDLSNKIKEANSLATLKVEFKAQLDYSRHMLLSTDYDARMTASELTQDVARRAAYEQFILKRLDGEIIPFLDAIRRELKVPEAKLPRTADEVMRFFAANDISGLAKRVIQAADQSDPLEETDLDRTLTLYNNYYDYIARGSSILQPIPKAEGYTAAQGATATKLTAALAALGLFTINKYSREIEETLDPEKYGSVMASNVAMILLKLLNAMPFFKNGPLNALLLCPNTIFNTGLVFTVSLAGRAFFDIYCSNSVAPLSMPGAAVMLPSSSHVSRMGVMGRITDLGSRVFSALKDGIGTMANTGFAISAAALVTAYYTDQHWGGFVNKMIKSATSGSAQTIMTAPVIPYFHIMNIATGAAVEDWKGYFVMLSPMDIATLLTYFCLFKNVFTMAQFHVGALVETTVKVASTNEVDETVVRTFSLLTNWNLIKQVLEVGKFIALTSLLNATRGGGFSNVSRLVNLNNSEFQQEFPDKYYIPVSSQEYAAFEKQMALLLTSMGFGIHLLRDAIVGLTGRDWLKTHQLPASTGYWSVARLGRRATQYAQVALSPIGALTGQSASMITHMAIKDLLFAGWKTLRFLTLRDRATKVVADELDRQEWMKEQRLSVARDYINELKQIIFHPYTIEEWRERHMTVAKDKPVGVSSGVVAWGFYEHFEEHVVRANVIMSKTVVDKLRSAFESVLSKDYLHDLHNYQDPTTANRPVFLIKKDLELMMGAFDSMQLTLAEYFNDELVKHPDSWVSNYTGFRALVAREGGWFPLLKLCFFTRDAPDFIGAIFKNVLFTYGAYTQHPSIAPLRDASPFVGAAVKDLVAANTSFGAAASYWAGLELDDFQGYSKLTGLFAVSAIKSLAYAEFVRSLQDNNYEQGGPLEEKMLNLFYIYLLELISHREFRLNVTAKLSAVARGWFSAKVLDPEDTGLSPAQRLDQLRTMSRDAIEDQRKSRVDKRTKRKEREIEAAKPTWQQSLVKYSLIGAVVASGVYNGVRLLTENEIGRESVATNTINPLSATLSYYNYTGMVYNPSPPAGTATELVVNFLAGGGGGGGGYKLKVFKPREEGQKTRMYSAEGMTADTINKQELDTWEYEDGMPLNSISIKYLVREQRTVFNPSTIDPYVTETSAGIPLYPFCPVRWTAGNALPQSYVLPGTNPQLVSEMDIQAQITLEIDAMLTASGVPTDSNANPNTNPFVYNRKSAIFPQNYLLTEVLLEDLVELHGADYIPRLMNLYGRAFRHFVPRPPPGVMTDDWNMYANPNVWAAADTKRRLAMRMLITSEFPKLMPLGTTGDFIFDHLNSLNYHTNYTTRYQERDMRLYDIIGIGQHRRIIDNLNYPFALLLHTKNRVEADALTFIAGSADKSDHEAWRAQQRNYDAVENFINIDKGATDMAIAQYKRDKEAKSLSLRIKPADANPLIALIEGGSSMNLIAAGAPEEIDSAVSLLRRGNLVKVELEEMSFFVANESVIAAIAKSGQTVHHINEQGEDAFMRGVELVELFDRLRGSVPSLSLIKLSDDELGDTWQMAVPFYASRFGDKLVLVYMDGYANRASYYSSARAELPGIDNIIVIPGVFTDEHPDGFLYVFTKAWLKDLYETTVREFKDDVVDAASSAWDSVFKECSNRGNCGTTKAVYTHIMTTPQLRARWSMMSEGQRLDRLTDFLQAAVDSSHGFTFAEQKAALQIGDVEYTPNAITYVRQLPYDPDTVGELAQRNKEDAQAKLPGVNIPESVDDTRAPNSNVAAILMAVPMFVYNYKEYFGSGVAAYGARKLYSLFTAGRTRTGPPPSESLPTGGVTQAKYTTAACSDPFEEFMRQCKCIQKKYKKLMRDVHAEMASDFLLQTAVETIRKDYHQYVAIDPLVLLTLQLTREIDKDLIRIARNVSHSDAPAGASEASASEAGWLGALTDPMQVYLNDRTEVLVLSTNPDLENRPDMGPEGVIVEAGIRVTNSNLDDYLIWKFIQREGAAKVKIMTTNAAKTGLIKKQL
jgi:hypothetical protein